MCLCGCVHGEEHEDATRVGAVCHCLSLCDYLAYIRYLSSLHKSGLARVGCVLGRRSKEKTSLMVETPNHTYFLLRVAVGLHFSQLKPDRYTEKAS